MLGYAELPDGKASPGVQTWSTINSSSKLLLPRHCGRHQAATAGQMLLSVSHKPQDISHQVYASTMCMLHPIVACTAGAVRH